MSFYTYPMVKVEWIDSCAFRGWRDPDEYKPKGPLPCKSVGYLQSQSKIQIIIVQSQSESGDNAEALFIPKVNIKSIKYLTTTKKRR